jgi:butyryl-CoA dehydrogenase
VDRLEAITAQLASAEQVDAVIANATSYLEATGHIVVAWTWLEQILALGDRTDDFGEGKRAAARYFFTNELPKTGPMLDLVEALDRAVLDTRGSWL